MSKNGNLPLETDKFINAYLPDRNGFVRNPLSQKKSITKVERCVCFGILLSSVLKEGSNVKKIGSSVSAFRIVINANKRPENCSFASFTADFKEFVCALSVTTRGTTKEKLQWAFSIYDINGDGSISSRELITIIKSIKSMADALDDHNATDDKILQIFKTFDINNDGVLTFEEFMVGARKDPLFMKMLDDYVST